MWLLADDTNNNGSILDTFFAIGSWQALLTIIIFIGLQVGFWYFLKFYKIKFLYRILIGLAVGLIFGIVIQAIGRFPVHGMVDETYPGNPVPGQPTPDEPNDGYRQWAVQLNIWVSLMKNIFINGILLLTAPVVFLAIFRVTSKPSSKRMGSITAKGLLILLANVAVAFIITFWIGYFIKTGKGADLAKYADATKDAHKTKTLPQIIWEYMPSNMIAPWLELAVIPLMVIGAIFGRSVKILSKRNQKDMDHIRHGADVAWKVVISVMMTFMKIMPLAVMSMIASSIISKPIGALSSIGKTLGVGYIGLLICAGIITLQILISGIKVGAWWKDAAKVLIQGFATQSSNATLPTSIEVLEQEMKVDTKVVSVLAPLSTSMGLMGCAGVQSGVITSFLWTAMPNQLGMSLAVYFILGLVVTVIASLGIAGIPGTASVVTAGVLGGLGLGQWFGPVYAIVGALDGLFDMGRTGINVLAPQAAAAIVAKTEGLILEGSPLLSEKQQAKQKLVREKIDRKEEERLAKEKARRAKIEARLHQTKKEKSNTQDKNGPAVME